MIQNTFARNNQIRVKSKKVVGDSAISLGRVWSFKRMTTNISVEPRIYAATWTEFAGLDTGLSQQQIWDEVRNRQKVVTAYGLRCAEDSPSPQLKQGDVVKSPEGLCFAILGLSGGGPGTVRYALERDDTLMADLNRSGGA